MSRACRKGSALTLVLAIGITSFLLAVLAHSSPNPARADTPEVITLVYPNFSDVSLLQLNGNAAKVGTALRVAPALGNQAGSAFFKTRVCLANQRSFSTYFSFLFTNPSTPPADGIVFAIQTVSNTAGSVGGGIGFRGISPSVGIEFDTYKNTGPLPDPIDPNDNHVGLDINGDVQSAVTANPPADMNGPTWHVWIDYSGLTDSLQVRMGLTNSRAAATLVMSQTVDLVAILDMDEVFVGYTAATGGKWENHDILGWYFDNDYDPIDVSTTTYSMAQTPAFTGAPTNTAQTVAEGAGLTAVAATDGDGSPITYSLETGALPVGITLQSDGSFLGTVDYSAFQNGPVYSSTIRAQDIYGLYADTSLVVTVTDTNRAPAYTGAPTNTAQTVAEGAGLVAVAAADPDSDTLTYSLQSGSLPVGITLQSDGSFLGTVDYAAFQNGPVYTATIRASDGGGLYADTSLVVTVTDTNRAPAYTGAPTNTAQTVAEGAGLVAVAATDPDSDTLTYSLQSGSLPVGITLQSDGSFLGTVDYAAFQNGPVYTATIRASDGGGLFADTSLVVTVTDTNRAPVYTGAPTNTAQTVAEGAGLVAVAATDPDSDTLTYSLQSGSLPVGITLQSDGSFLGTVDYAAFQNGPVYTATIRASDGGGLFADTSLVVTVTDTNRPPSITGGLTQVLAEGGHLTDLTASDPDGDPLTWTLTGALPDGITWDGDGTFSGMASDRSAGLYGPVVGVSDGKGGTDSQIMSIRVQNVVHEPVLAPVLGVNLSVNGRVFGEGSTIEFTLEYQNGPATVARGVLITASIPDHTGLIDCGAGTAAGSSVAWLLPEMGAGERGTLTYRVRVSTLPSAEEIASSTAAISCSTGDERGEARVEVLLFSNRYGPQVHRPYIIGYPDGEFKPYGPLTRAEIATAFMRILDLEELAMGQSLYADVDPTFWAASAIEAVTRAELMEGYADGTFRPNQPITRAELAAIAARAAGAVGAPPITHHLGDLGDHWALDFIEGCFRSGIITGYGDSTFRPDSLILRDEAVTIINRLFYRGPLLGRAASFPDVDQEQWFFEQVEESAGGHDFMRNQDGSETEQP